MKSLPEEWRQGAPDGFDLVDLTHDHWVRSLAEKMITSVSTVAELETLENAWAEANVPIAFRVAARLANSRMLLASVPKAHLTVVFAAYKEHGRLRPADEHEHGEDALMRKIEQLDWLTQGLPGISWNMLMVDDGCPEQSGRIAQDILAKRYEGNDVEILFLADGIAENHPATLGLRSPADSQKGGAVLYGMSRATELGRDHHVVAFTDADLSTHLGQCGLLIHPILQKGAAAAIGSRREPLSVAVKRGSRNTRGKLFIYLWKHMITALGPIIDTQCGFKGFDAKIAQQICLDAVEKRFAFDIELLLKVERLGGSLTKVPIAWIDSEAASTTAELQPYLPMLKSIARISGVHLPQTDQTQAFRTMIEALSEAEWARLVDHVPTAIAELEASEIGSFDGVSPDRLVDIARS